MDANSHGFQGVKVVDSAMVVAIFLRGILIEILIAQSASISP